MSEEPVISPFERLKYREFVDYFDKPTNYYEFAELIGASMQTARKHIRVMVALGMIKELPFSIEKKKVFLRADMYLMPGMQDGVRVVQDPREAARAELSYLTNGNRIESFMLDVLNTGTISTKWVASWMLWRVFYARLMKLKVDEIPYAISKLPGEREVRQILDNEIELLEFKLEFMKRFRSSAQYGGKNLQWVYEIDWNNFTSMVVTFIQEFGKDVSPEVPLSEIISELLEVLIETSPEVLDFQAGLLTEISINRQKARESDYLENPTKLSEEESAEAAEAAEVSVDDAGTDYPTLRPVNGQSSGSESSSNS